MAALRSLTAMLVALFVVGAGLGDSFLMCRSLRTVHRACCCTHKQVERAVTVELSRAPCCDAVSVDAAAIPPSSGAAPDFALAVPILIADAMIEPRMIAPPSLPWAMARLAAPFSTGPPPHIKHHALLI